MGIRTFTKSKNPRSRQIAFICFCGQSFWESPRLASRKLRHFCSMKCYSDYRRVAPPEEHNRWQGGVSNTEAHRRWKKRHPERMAFLKARRYARERGAIGSHTLTEWQEMKKRFKFSCAMCQMKKPLTQDHIIPLSKGGSDYIVNIQPLCRNCNSKKHNKLIYESPSLLVRDGEGKE